MEAIQERTEPQKSFWNKHKKKITLGISFVVGMITGYLLYKNKNDAVDFLKLFRNQSVKNIAESPETITPKKMVEAMTKQHIDVPMHTRNLPKGQKASALKIEQAVEYGYKLSENQTWVKEYSYAKAA